MMAIRCNETMHRAALCVGKIWLAWRKATEVRSDIAYVRVGGHPRKVRFHNGQVATPVMIETGYNIPVIGVGMKQTGGRWTGGLSRQAGIQAAPDKPG